MWKACQRLRVSVSTCTMLFTFVRVTSEKIAQKLAIDREKNVQSYKTHMHAWHAKMSE